jgi:isoleucyl-tRNA synthetase
MVCRYNNMLGHNVIHKLGWDVHGLPTEVMVEKATGKQAKDLVAEFGIEKFCDMCRDGVMKYVGEWNMYLNRIGRWVDIGDGDIVYNTMYPTYMESVIWALKKLYDDGLLYKDFKVNPFDWKLGTVMSNSEASSEYQDIIDDAITVWFELKPMKNKDNHGIQLSDKKHIVESDKGEPRRILAWTTTPWTLPANSALAVNPKLTYAIMRNEDGKEYIIAESRVAAFEKQFTKAVQFGQISGTDLINLRYEPLFDYYKKHSEDTDGAIRMHYIIAADYVSDDSGTGIVHIAPAFGEDDYLSVKAIDPKFPVIVNVDDYGNFAPEVRDFAGMNIFEANPKIIEALKSKGQLVKKEQYKHSYPFSPRSKEKLIYRATDAWYIDVPKIKSNLIEQNSKVDWKSAGGRFRDWIENARPWGISRNRFWGVPLPIWEKDGEYKFFGSIAEMEDFFGVKITDLHRATLDALSKDGWTRIPDVLDAWFESGAMPFAHMHYPFENKDLVEAKDYMSDYIIEGQDQTRGWFYTLMVLSTALFNRPAFSTISANGLTVDEHKKKMSKSLGNYVDPAVVLDTYGADAVRLYILGSNFMKAEPVPVDKEGKVFGEPTKNILVPLWNAYHFFTLYANAGNVKADGDYTFANVMDFYIFNELDELTDAVRAALDEYKPDIAIREFTRFLEVLNNWYIRRSRERFWNEDKDAFNMLYHVLCEFCKLLAPFAPFVSDYIFRNLTGQESVHLEKFPTPGNKPIMNVNGIYVELLDIMRGIQSIVSVGKQLREKFGLRNRLPLARLTIIREAGSRGFDSELTGIIKDELNIKTVVWSDDVAAVADSFVYLLTPKIGARLGAGLKDIAAAVKNGDYRIETGELIAFVGAENFPPLRADEYEMRLTVKPGITGAALPDNTAVVVLDANVTKELEMEGLARDALRFIQDSRKSAGLDVSDRIVLEYSADGQLADAIGAHAEMIKENALAIELKKIAEQDDDVFIGCGRFGVAGYYHQEIEGHRFGINITRESNKKETK